MCPTCEPEQSNGANGTNGANGANGHEGFTSVQSHHNPHPSHKSPYQPVGDFLSNVSRFKIIGTSLPISPADSDASERCKPLQLLLPIRKEFR
jgi:homocitrate synthase